MNQNAQQPVEINLMDLLFVIIKKAGIIFLTGIVLAGAVFGYIVFSGAQDANVLDTSVKLEGESDVDYAQRTLNVNRASDLVSSIDALNAQVDNQRKYMTDSLLMQIDAENEAITTAQLVVTTDERQASGTGLTLASAYSQDILSGDYLTDLANELQTNQGYITELITAEYAPEESVMVNESGENGSTGTVSIRVIGPTIEYTDRIMDLIIEEANVAYTEFNENVVPHSMTIVGRQSAYVVDSATRDLQYVAASRFEILQKQITTFDDSLKELAGTLGVAGKSSLYAYFSYDDDSVTKQSLSSVLKFAFVGFAAGVILVVALIIVSYIFGNKFSTQASFFAKFPNLKKIGVVKPVSKRSAFTKAIECKMDDDTTLSDDDNNKLIVANLKNLTNGMNKILFTGTADADKIKSLVEKLGIKADVKKSIFDDPTGLESISEYDGVVIVEQRNHSEFKLVKKEIQLITNTDAKLIGAVVI